MSVRFKMQIVRTTLDRFPRFRRFLKSLYFFVQGTPQVSYSEITQEIMRQCIGKSHPTILEIGCNDGDHTLWFLETFDNPRVYCFEPDPRAIARFKAKVGQRPNVDLFEIALSDRNGEITFYQSGGRADEQQAKTMPEGWDLSGSIRKPKDHLVLSPWVTFDNALTVKTTTLDAWCEEHAVQTVDFIWMDVQGAEIDVFRGGMNTLARTRFIYTEYSNRELYEGQLPFRQLLKQLRDFEVVVRYPNDVLLKNKRFDFVSGRTNSDR